MEIKDMIKVLEGFRDGKTIQYWSIDNIWRDVSGNTPTWNFLKETYRIKPEPLECWVHVSEDGSEVFSQNVFYNSAAAYTCLTPNRKVIHMREVTDE